MERGAGRMEGLKGVDGGFDVVEYLREDGVGSKRRRGRKEVKKEEQKRG